MDIWLPGGPPSLCGRLLVPCPFNCMGFVLVPLMSACVLLPVLREVDFRTSCLRHVRPSGVLCRSHSACGVTSRCRPSWLASSRKPRFRSWSRVMLTIQVNGPLVPYSSQKSLRKHDSWLGYRCARPSWSSIAGSHSQLVLEDVLPG